MERSLFKPPLPDPNQGFNLINSHLKVNAHLKSALPEKIRVISFIILYGKMFQ